MPQNFKFEKIAVISHNMKMENFTVKNEEYDWQKVVGLHE